jgi:hypothetical protein
MGGKEPTSAVSGAMDGEANEAKGMFRSPAYSASFDNRYLKLMVRWKPEPPWGA